ncbi:hypothetical protein [Pedobacter hiemivivus]|uniref:Uncharacterized protein n=1 Tax=Pedobacter hiemivivus TaxID=2530454 RepID=A0A4V2MKV4_9SPHI|nr:hypothetical protein [Pedobacter hiemivivus]TCC99696.1 hypothetical protein EZ444_03225 [Pedobacter hiemivivus]
MDVNKEVIFSLGLLSEKDKSFFGLFCVKRISGLYDLFDHLIELEKLESPNKNYELIRGIIKYLEESVLSNIKIQRSTIDGFTEKLNSIPFDDLYGSCDEFMLAANVLSSIENLLNFHVKKDEKYIVKCIDLLINTINIIVSQHLFNIDDGISYEEKEHVLVKHYAREIEIELTFIEMLRKNASGNELIAFINDHLILISKYEKFIS